MEMIDNFTYQDVCTPAFPAPLLIPTSSTWSKAIKACELLKSNVVVIDSKDKQEMILAIFRQFEDEHPEVMKTTRGKIWSGFVDSDHNSK